MGERYLGLPVSVGTARKRTFSYIKRWIWSKVQGWQAKLLSKTGKEILIKAVAQAISTYVMSCFDITKGLCDELSFMIGRYWWSQQDKVHKIHWLGWETLSRSKKQGELGFRDLHLFNTAMLARQAWRLLSNPETLCGSVLKAKYFLNGSILRCLPRSGMSYSWRSILQGVELIKEGIIWRVGDGSQINTWEDPWLPRGVTRRPMTPRGLSLLTTVDELIDPLTGSWDAQSVTATFWPEDATLILGLPVRVDVQDRPAWHYDSKRRFSVKSTYKLAVQIRDRKQARRASAATSAQDAGFPWQKIWQLALPNKVKMFLWRLTHNSLPVKRRLCKRGVKSETLCPVCRRFDEDCGHMFFKCKYGRAVWREHGVYQR